MTIKEQDDQSVRTFWISQFRMMTFQRSHLFNSLEPDIAVQTLIKYETEAKSVIERTLKKLNIDEIPGIVNIMLTGSYAAGTNKYKSDINFVLETTMITSLSEVEKQLNEANMTFRNIPMHIVLLPLTTSLSADTDGYTLNVQSLPYYLYNEMVRLSDNMYKDFDKPVKMFLEYVQDSIVIAEPVTNKTYDINETISTAIDKIKNKRALTYEETMSLLRLYQASNINLCVRTEQLEKNITHETIVRLRQENKELKQTLYEQNDAIDRLHGVIERYQMMTQPPASQYLQ